MQRGDCVPLGCAGLLPAFANQVEFAAELGLQDSASEPLHRSNCSTPTPPSDSKPVQTNCRGSDNRAADYFSIVPLLHI